METSITYILLGLIVIGLIAYWINLIKNNRSKYLRQMGYEYVYYYMFYCNNINYYRNPSLHIQNKYAHFYNELTKKKNGWFVTQKSREKIDLLIEFYVEAKKYTISVSPYFSPTHYFTYSESEPHLDSIEKLEKMAVLIANSEFKKCILEKFKDKEITKYPQYNRYRLHIDSLRESHNREFVAKQLKDNATYFDSLLKYPLDAQQRDAIVRLEDNCLVISSAGSGKTSTSIAKVKYLIEKQHINKEEILVLSYNRKTAEEFQNRLNIEGLECKTFHAFAMAIIAKVESRRPDICEETFLITCFYNLVRTDQQFKANINKFFGELFSLTKFEHYYDNAEDYYKDRETYGIIAPYGDMRNDVIYTRSEEEKKICTWLSTHGVNFLYEEPYKYPTADEEHRQYKPDFTIYYEINGKIECLYLEHFAIDAKGNVPYWFGQGGRGFQDANARYNKDIQWKRRLHHDKKTLLIETTSAMFHNGTIYDRLEEQLHSYGISTEELSEDEKYDLLVSRNRTMEDNVKTLFLSFINLMKSNCKTFDSIMEAIENEASASPIQKLLHGIGITQPKTDRTVTKEFCDRSRFLMYNLIKPLYENYQSAMAKRGQMDFIDLILRATELCETGKYKTPFTYIVVDEFQDISVDRYKFLVSLRQKNPLTKIFCVGDDWQSIYRFSGSDINLFNNFEEYFGHTYKCKIETTYRFGNPLVYRSSLFIMKNPAQVKKGVRPCTNTSTDISFIPYAKSLSQYLNIIQKIIEDIPPTQSILLLGRYNHDVTVFPKNSIEQNPDGKRAVVTFANRKMQFMSVHAAKGLEADNVIILNCSQDRAGFPSRISDDPILGFVLSDIDDFEYSEERRLFYVAITRAKKHTYVLYNDLVPSAFVTEMIKDNQNHREQVVCPQCKKGKLIVLKVARATGGSQSYYCTLSCSNSIAGCRYMDTLFFDNPNQFTPQYRAILNKYAIQSGENTIDDYLRRNYPGTDNRN